MVQRWVHDLAAFHALPSDQKTSIILAAEVAEARGWKIAEEKSAWYSEQLIAKGMKILPPSPSLKDGLKKIGVQLTDDWKKRAGSSGDEVLSFYLKQVQ